MKVLTGSKSVPVAVQQAKPPPAPAAPPPAPATRKFKADEMSTGRGGALRRQAATQLNASTSTVATTLRTERLGDGRSNCLEQAMKLSGPNDQLVLLDDSRDGSGHALVQHPDGSITDPNYPQVRYQSLAQWQAANPSYSVAARAPANAVRLALQAPVGPARDAALAALGLSKAADIAVADETTTPAWVTLNPRAKLRSTEPPFELVAQSDEEVNAEVIGVVPEGELLDGLHELGEGAWYEVQLESGETGYVWAENTTSEFDAELSTELGEATSPVRHDEAGNALQSFEHGEVVLRPDGVREVTPAEGEAFELAPQWGTFIPNARVRDEHGNLITGLGGQPMQIIRQVPDDQDGTFDAIGAGDWFQVRLADGSTAYVRSDNFGPPVTDPRLGSLVPEALGAAQGPMLPLEGGGFSQAYEHGEVRLDEDGNVSVRNAEGEEIASRPASTVSSTAQANAFHVTQRGRTKASSVNEDGVPVDAAGNPVGNSYNDGSEWYAFNDCGPTSVVMAASMVGAIDNPDAAGAGEAIDAVRDSIFDTDTKTSLTTTAAQVAEGARELGANAVEHYPATLSAVDAALEAGNPVILGGDPMDSWGADDPHYLEAGSDGFNHWVVVSGRTESGNYLINDPLAPNGAIEVTPEQLEAYLNGGMGMVEVMP